MTTYTPFQGKRKNEVGATSVETEKSSEEIQESSDGLINGKSAEEWFNYGRQYYIGEGCQQSTEKALYWLEKVDNQIMESWLQKRVRLWNN